MKRVATVAVGVMMATAVVATAPASAENKDEGSFGCQVTATPDGIAVRWQKGRFVHEEANPVDRFVIERQVFDRYHWRGRTAFSETTFADSGTPSNVGNLRYRVTARLGSEIVGSVDCAFLNSPGLACQDERLDGGRFGLEWQSDVPANGANVDYVIRRWVDANDEGPSFWRGRTEETSFIDGPSWFGDAGYEVIQRFDRRIVGAVRCRPPQR